MSGIFPKTASLPSKPRLSRFRKWTTFTARMSLLCLCLCQQNVAEVVCAANYQALSAMKMTQPKKPSEKPFRLPCYSRTIVIAVWWLQKKKYKHLVCLNWNLQVKSNWSSKLSHLGNHLTLLINQLCHQRGRVLRLGSRTFKDKWSWGRKSLLRTLNHR